jgi:hypothetical protein
MTRVLCRFVIKKAVLTQSTVDPPVSLTPGLRLVHDLARNCLPRSLQIARYGIGRSPSLNYRPIPLCDWGIKHCATAPGARADRLAAYTILAPFLSSPERIEPTGGGPRYEPAILRRSRSRHAPPL